MRKLVCNTHGLTTVEHIVVLCLVGVVAVPAFSALGSTLRRKIYGATEVVSGIEASSHSKPSNLPAPPTVARRHDPPGTVQPTEQPGRLRALLSGIGSLLGPNEAAAAEGIDMGGDPGHSQASPPVPVPPDPQPYQPNMFTRAKWALNDAYYAVSEWLDPPSRESFPITPTLSPTSPEARPIVGGFGEALSTRGETFRPEDIEVMPKGRFAVDLDGDGHVLASNRFTSPHDGSPKDTRFAIVGRVTPTEVKMQIRDRDKYYGEDLGAVPGSRVVNVHGGSEAEIRDAVRRAAETTLRTVHRIVQGDPTDMSF